jgi:16S rRNA (guanine(966)-N(2))-methyltransferase RsmD
MRIIAGIYRSRILRSLKGLALRPTSDRLRETLFDVLGGAVEGSRFIDIFAGTGAVGVEAFSRGAAEVVLIENHLPAAALIRRNLESLDIDSGATILPVDALRALEKLSEKYRSSDAPFDFVFIDPPYSATHEYTRVLHFLGVANFLAPRSIVIAEHRRDFTLPEEFGNLQRNRILKQGDAALSFFRRRAAPKDSGVGG